VSNIAPGPKLRSQAGRNTVSQYVPSDTIDTKPTCGTRGNICTHVSTKIHRPEIF